MKIVILLVLCFTLSLQDCRFATKYTQEQLKSSHKIVNAFLQEAVSWESKFMKELGVDEKSGLTLDGQQLDVETGLPLGKPHQFTAPSKESVHLGILAQVLAKNEFVTQIYTIEEAFTLIRKKLNTYQSFDKQYPGYGGYLPWVYVVDGEVTPTEGWTSGVPSLDNGEWFWALYGLVSALESHYPEEIELIEQYSEVYQKMARNSVRMFYEGEGKIRAEAGIQDIGKVPEENVYWNKGGDYFLDDPYEGELIAWMMHFFGSWEDPEEREKIWIHKRIKSQVAEYYIPQLNKTLTVQKGFWFSAHEQWKYLFLPYQYNRLSQQLLINAEKVRSWDANIKKRPGMLASVTGNLTENGNPEYWSDCGVPEVSFQKVYHDYVVTPYSTMAMFLVERNVAAAWYHNMISGPAGQNIYGTTEGVSIFGESVSPVVTWDSKITTVLGMTGGLKKLTSRKLLHEGKLKEFLFLLDRELKHVFQTIDGVDVEFAYPEHQFEQLREDFTSCRVNK